MDAARFRKLLEDERTDVETSLAPIRERLSVGQLESTGELAAADQHPADSASETEARELDLTRQVMFEARLHRIDEALRRIGDGSYGRCIVCGEQIPEERLEARPESGYCVKDAAQAELA